jgi:hypothetical protein
VDAWDSIKRFNLVARFQNQDLNLYCLFYIQLSEVRTQLRAGDELEVPVPLVAPVVLL